MPLLPFSVLPLGQETTGTVTRLKIHIGELVCQKVPATWPAGGLPKPTQSTKLSRQVMKKTSVLFPPARIFSKLDKLGWLETLPLLRFGLKRPRVSQVTRGPSDRQHKPLTFFSQHHKANHLLTYPTLHFSESVNWLAQLHMIFTRLTKFFLRLLYQAPTITFLMSSDKYALKRSVASFCLCCQPKSMTMSILVMLPMFCSLWNGVFLSLSCYLYNFLLQKEGKEHKKLLGE